MDGGGGAGGSRTPDLLRAKQALSQLSYSPTDWRDGLSRSASGSREAKRAIAGPLMLAP